MGKVEPMSEEHIKALAQYRGTLVHPIDDCIQCRLILAYAHAQAEAEEMRWRYFHRDTKEWGCESCDPWENKERDFRHAYTDADWLNAILTRIGWVE